MTASSDPQVTPAGPLIANGPIGRVAALVPLAFVVIAEAAWIAVVGGLVQEISQRDPVLGIPALAAFVAVGIVAARVLGPRLGDRWPVVALGLIAAGASLGWSLAADARDAFRAGAGPGAAIAAHPGGLVAGLAVLRGFAHARLPLAEGTVARLLGIGVPGVAVAALLGGAIGEPFRSRFLADALSASIVFVASAVLALAFARLAAIGTDGGFDWRANPAWLALTLVLLIGAIVAALPLAAVAGTVISVVISAALFPMLIVGLAMGFDRTGRRVLGFIVVAGLLVYLLGRAGVPGVLPAPTVPTAVGPPQASPVEQMLTLSLGGLLLIAGVAGIVLLVALWMRRVRPIDESVVEERTIELGGEAPPRRRPRRWLSRGPDPTSASAAYVALIDELDRHTDVRRWPAETPAEHAARLRAIGRSDLSLHLLAADYALARYGGAKLSAREDRRGVARWRVLRRGLPNAPPGWVRPTDEADDPARRPGRDATPPEDVEPRRTL